jgi:phasin family protein
VVNRNYVAVQKEICCFFKHFIIMRFKHMSSKTASKAASSKNQAKQPVKKAAKAVLPKTNPLKTNIVTFENIKRNAAKQRETMMQNNAQNPFQNVAQNAAEQIEKANRQLTSSLEEAASFNRNNLDAAVQAANCVAEGIKDVNQAVFGHIQQSLQSAMTTGKAMMGVKSLKDLMELQQEYIKTTFDSFMSESTKISEIAVRCSNEAAQPINARVTEVVGKVSKAATKKAA